MNQTNIMPTRRSGFTEYRPVVVSSTAIALLVLASLLATAGETVNAPASEGKAAGRTQSSDVEAQLVRVVPIEKATCIVKQFKLNGFYKKLVDADGLPIVASNQVADAALLEAAYLIDRMLDGRDDIRRALVKNRTRFVVMATNEFTTEIPEHSDLTPKNFWDRRARGLGATPQRPAVSCGEENLLRCPGDPYHKENILIHEFAHAMHHMGLDAIDKQFDPKLKSIYEQAMKEELWKHKYAATNRAEYWAEGVQSYFGTNRPPDHDHNHVDTRDELKDYDPRLFTLIDGVFRKNPWQYSRPEKRNQQPHLRDLDRAKLPKFRWPERLAEESAKIEAFKKARQKKADDDKQAGGKKSESKVK